MHDAALVRGVEGIGDLPCDAHGLLDRQRRASEALGQRGAFDQLHHDAADVVGVLDAVDVRDVRVIERGEDLRLAREPRQPLAVAGEAGRQHLDGDVALQAVVARAIDLAHAAGPDRSDDLVVTECRARRQHAGTSRFWRWRVVRTRQGYWSPAGVAKLAIAA